MIVETFLTTSLLWLLLLQFISASIGEKTAKMYTNNEIIFFKNNLGLTELLEKKELTMIIFSKSRRRNHLFEIRFTLIIFYYTHFSHFDGNIIKRRDWLMRFFQDIPFNYTQWRFKCSILLNKMQWMKSREKVRKYISCQTTSAGILL